MSVDLYMYTHMYTSQLEHILFMLTLSKATTGSLFGLSLRNFRIQIYTFIAWDCWRHLLGVRRTSGAATSHQWEAEEAEFRIIGTIYKQVNPLHTFNTHIMHYAPYVYTDICMCVA